MTRQVLDKVTIDGETYPTSSQPLADYFKLFPDAENELHKDSQTMSFSTNWRGYSAEWAIEDNLLYLSKVSVPKRKNRAEKNASKPRTTINAGPIDCLNLLFPDSKSKVKADWFTGELGTSRGLEIYTPNAPVASHEYKVIYQIAQGKLQETRLIDNRIKFLHHCKEIANKNPSTKEQIEVVKSYLRRGNILDEASEPVRLAWSKIKQPLSGDEFTSPDDIPF